VRRWLFVLVLLGLAGCGRATTVVEQDLVVRGGDAVPTRTALDQQSRGLRIANARIVFVTHGQASDPFWAVVKKGYSDAAKQTGTAVSYRAPDSFSIARMKRFIDQAVADHPDGLVVSVPDVEALRPSIEKAVAAGIPTITINSGADVFKSLGVLAHVGQPEYAAGVESGDRLAAAGVRSALCVNQETGNGGLDERCRGLGDALRKHGGSARSLSVPLQNPALAQRRMAQAITSESVDGILTLGPGIAMPAIAAVSASGKRSDITLATFDLSADVLEAVRDGKMLFAVDQQPYLQGFLPVVLLAQRAKLKVFPGSQRLIPTGPKFITKTDAAEVIELSADGYR
jgi:simple sugar transport system substrate-binding protein